MSEPMIPDPTEDRLVHRLVFFTDAVFAIVLTILVLELHPPMTPAEANLGRFLETLPHLLAYALSFGIVAVYWVAHLNVTRRLVHFDWPVTVANLVFLGVLSLLPYATAWLGADIFGVTAWSLYSITLIVISLANMALILTVLRDGGRLVGGVEPGEVRLRLLRSGAPGAAFVVGLACAQAGWPLGAQACALLIPVIIALVSRFARARPARDPEQVHNDPSRG